MNVLDCIGNTPLIDISFLFEKENVQVFAKAEWMNPGGSIKDRPVKRMLEEAVKDGSLTKERTILDSSSGNAGIAYAMIGNAMGYNVKIVLPGNASDERKARIKAHGAEIHETDALEGYDFALTTVRKMYEENPGQYFFCDQYANDNNWLAHYHGTGEEIIKDITAIPDYFVGGVGTGGSLTGISRRLKKTYDNVKTIAVRPEVWPGIEGLKPLSDEGDIIPEIYDASLVDDWVDITADSAKSFCRKISQHGIFVGQSSGAYLSGVAELLKKIDSGVVVTLLPDLGERYFSTGLWS